MDENRDKEMARNNLIAVVLFALLFVVWITWMAPKPSKKPQTPPQQVQTQPVQPKPVEEKPRTEQLAGLPPIPTVTDPTQDEVAIGDSELKLVFTRIGARLKEANVIVGKNGEKSVQLVPNNAEPDTKAVYPLGITFTDKAIGDALDARRFDVEEAPDGKSVTFSIILPEKAVIRKRFSLAGTRHVLDIQIEYENLESKAAVNGMDQIPAYYLTWGPNVSSGDDKMGVQQSIVWLKDALVSDLLTAKFTPAKDGVPFSNTVLTPEWAAIRSAYFVVAFRPDFEGSQARMSGTQKQFQLAMSAPRFDVAPNETKSHAFKLYVGPSEQSSLAAAWTSLPKLQRFFSPPWTFMDKFAKLLLATLNFFYNHVLANYGVAIIFLTVLVRLGMYPLTLKSMKSMKKMQILGPEMQEIKTKYAEDPQEMNKRMMELYKERGVNPLGGCLPMMLQMPVFIALYRMLWSAYELRGAPFVLWIQDLSQPDHLCHLPWMASVPFLGATFQELNLLPILMAVAMVFNSKMMPTGGPSQNPQQKMMMTIMPVFFSFITYNMASGLNLYILTSTVLGMVQQKFTRVDDTDVEKKKKIVGKRQHFYTAAKARQRQLAREAKKERKR